MKAAISRELRLAIGLLGALTLILNPAAIDAEPKPIDLEGLIEKRCGPPGYRRDSGCRIRLGPGTFTVPKTVRLGACSAKTVRNSVTLEGESAGGVTQTPRMSTAGTTLTWAGEPGGVMLDICGASFLSLRDITLDASSAGTAVRVSSNNQSSGISHFVELKNLVINGSEIGVEVTGKSFNDQSDFVTLERVSMREVGVGYLQDSSQTVGGRIETVEVAARRRGFEIRNGSLVCDGCYVGSLPAKTQTDSDFVAFHLRRSADRTRPWASHHQVHIRNSHMEVERGSFVKSETGSRYPVTLIGNSYSMQCKKAKCEMTLVEMRSEAPLVMIGEVVQAASNPPARPTGRVCYEGPELVKLGVHVKPEVERLVWECGDASRIVPGSLDK